MREDYAKWVYTEYARQDRKRMTAEDNYQQTGIQRFANERDRAYYFCDALIAAQEKLEHVSAGSEAAKSYVKGLYERCKLVSERKSPEDALREILELIRTAEYFV